MKEWNELVKMYQKLSDERDCSKSALDRAYEEIAELEAENARLTGLLESVEAAANETLVDLGHAQQEIDRLKADNARLVRNLSEANRTVGVCRRAIKVKEQEVRCLREAQRWIPVSERMPAGDNERIVLGRYHVHFANGNHSACWYYALVMRYSEKWECPHTGTKYLIEEWQPLPREIELPEEGKK